MFQDRYEAGKFLATKLEKYAARKDVLILALPRGGVPVAYGLANSLDLPFDLYFVRKIGLPGHKELAIGAIASGGVTVFNHEIIRQLDLPQSIVDQARAIAQRELHEQEQKLRGHRERPKINNRTIILVDDGLATGATMRAALQAVRQLEPAKVVVAVPVGASEACADFTEIADEFVCAKQPEPFRAVGIWYHDFSPITDAEVRELLETSHAAH
jgi:putative phosphoribosyl transferase